MPDLERQPWQNKLSHSYTPRRIQQIVKELAREGGIVKNVYPHLLRHTIAQYLVDRGMPEHLLQKFLGHDSPRTIMSRRACW